MTALAAILLAAAQSAEAVDWQSVAQLEPGPERGASIATLLEDPAVELRPDSLQLGYEAGLRASDALELELALRVQTALHERAAAIWSGFNLAITLSRAGYAQRADRLLESLLALAGPRDLAPLWNQRGIIAWGAGDELAARAAYGHAMAAGSADAAAILAREELSRHNLQAARSGFLAALNRSPEHPWGLRGWGLTLLDAPPP